MTPTKENHTEKKWDMKWNIRLSNLGVSKDSGSIEVGFVSVYSSSQNKGTPNVDPKML